MQSQQVLHEQAKCRQNEVIQRRKEFRITSKHSQPAGQLELSEESMVHHVTIQQTAFTPVSPGMVMPASIDDGPQDQVPYTLHVTGCVVLCVVQ
jgi:hypothetical protein